MMIDRPTAGALYGIIQRRIGASTRVTLIAKGYEGERLREMLRILRDPHGEVQDAKNRAKDRRRQHEERRRRESDHTLGLPDQDDETDQC